MAIWTADLQGQVESLLLNRWTLETETTDNRDIYACEMPASVHTVLEEHGKINNPYSYENESDLEWIEQADWTFKTKFQLSHEQLAAQHIILEMKEIDTHAKIYLNNKLIGEHHNFFIPFKQDIKPFLKIAGEYELKVLLESPVKYGNRKLLDHGYGFPADNDQTKNKVGPFSRKPAYHFGWDFAPKFIPAGIYQIPQLTLYQDSYIEYLSIKTKQAPDDKAVLEADIEMHTSRPYRVEIYNLTDNVTAGEASVEDNSSQILFEVFSPKKWWPKGFGKANLYRFQVRVFVDDQEVDSRIVTTGIRTTELVQEPDDFGSSFYFKINGHPIFCRGVNHSPLNVFLDKVKRSDYDSYFQKLNALNINMIRVWGGGTYERSVFYELCDQYGIMVWQDFMFANTTYPVFPIQAKDESEYQLRRLSHHPCIVHWNGNNEIDVAWKNWGWQETYKMSSETQKSMVSNYDKLFRALLPKQVAAYTNCSYTHSSPLSNWGPKGDFGSGSMHYWGVWHGKDNIDDYYKNVGRFMAEYGFQSYPSKPVLKAFCDGDSLTKAYMISRQKSYVGDGEIERQILEYFGKYNNDFFYMSQLIQALAMEKALIAHRKNKPRCYGSLVWQAADCWPGASWSILDMFQHPKAAYKTLQSLMHTVQVLEEVQPEQLKVFAVNDSIEDIQAIAEIGIYDFSGNEIAFLKQSVLLKRSEPTEVASIELRDVLDDFDHGQVYAIAALKTGKHELCKRIFLLEKPKDLQLVDPTNQLEYKSDNGHDWVRSGTFVYMPQFNLEGKPLASGCSLIPKDGHMLPGVWYKYKKGSEFNCFLPVRD